MRRAFGMFDKVQVSSQTWYVVVYMELPNLSYVISEHCWRIELLYNGWIVLA